MTQILNSQPSHKPVPLSYLSIIDFTVALHEFVDEKKLLEFALDSALGMINANAGSIFIWDAKSKELVLKVVRGPYQTKVTGARVKLREGISGWVADQGRSVLVEDVQQDQRFQEAKRFNHYHTSSFLSLSLLAGNKLLGIVNITEKSDQMPFTQDDFNLANAISKHIAVSYENLRLEKRLKQENEELSLSVTELSRVLQQQEALASIGKLASNLAHELNNPLDGIRRFVNLALDQVMEDSVAREYLLKAKSGIRRTIQIIRGLLSFAGEIGRQNQKISEIHSAIQQSISCAQQNPAFSGIEFETQFMDGAAPLYVSDTGLNTVFQNLFKNASDAMEGKGKIAVSTSLKDHSIVISVRDYGCGVSEIYQNRLFEPFFTTKERGQGTGIGLAICHEIMQRSHGEIFFQSQEGLGTTFYLKLPYRQRKES